MNQSQEPTKTLAQVLAEAMTSHQANVHTAAIARVQNVNAKTIDVKPVVNRVVNGVSIELPVFADVLPWFQGGGSSYIATPIAVGDYALLIFSERCFDLWYSGQDFKAPIDRRMHDYSDAIALVGLQPSASLLTIPDETTLNGVTRIGVANPSDFAALASKVLTELQAVQNDITVLKAATSTALGGVPTSGSALKSAFDIATAAIPHAPTSVASAYVKCE